MNLHIIAFGKCRTPGLKDTKAYYQKMISPWAQCMEHELKIEPQSSRHQSQLHDSRKIDTFCQSLPHAKLYLLDEDGKTQKSSLWASMLQKEMDLYGRLPLFCLAGPWGFEPEWKQQHPRLSLGIQTLSADLARIVLFEQLYRALSICKNHPYHIE